MLDSIRRSSTTAALAIALVVATLGLGLSDLLHTDAGEDLLCQLVQGQLVRHDESQHQMGRAQEPGAPSQHCYLCHWLRSLSFSLETGQPVLRSQPRTTVVLAARIAVCDRLLVNLVAARAPPA